MSVIQMVRPVTRAMACSACGAAGEANCDCGAPYMPASVRAAKAIAENPHKSDRAIAAEIGVTHPTVAKARREATGKPLPVDTRVGLDGKVRKLPRKPEPQDEMPTQEEADESYQQTLYDQACLFLESMTGETRQRFFAHIRRRYDA